MVPQYGKGFIRIAGLSGAAAVGLGAYGAHGGSNLHTVKRFIMRVFVLETSQNIFSQVLENVRSLLLLAMGNVHSNFAKLLKISRTLT